MKTLLLYNNEAGKGRIAKRIAAIVDIFAARGIDATPKPIVFGQNPFKDDEDVELAVVCGGDGTINYVVNAMYALAIRPTLGIIPAGTANDFARSIGMQKSILKAAEQIANGVEHKVDCGFVNDYYFVNVLSFGVFTTTSQQTSDREKHIVGKLAYLRVGSRDLMTMHRIPLFVKINGEEFSTDAAIFLAFNGKSAGQFKLAPDAQPDDGLLDIIILEYHNPVAACWDMLRYAMGGKPKAVRYIKSAEIELHSDIDERTDVDGQRGPSFPMKIRCIAGGITVRC